MCVYACVCVCVCVWICERDLISLRHFLTLTQTTSLTPTHTHLQLLEMGQRVLDNPSSLSDFGAALTSASPQDLQEILSLSLVETRLSKTMELLKRELLQCKIQNKISEEVEERVSKTRREHMLHEQLRAIKKELGLGKDDKEAIVARVREAVKERKIVGEAQRVIEEEIAKIQYLEQASSEFK